MRFKKINLILLLFLISILSCNDVNNDVTTPHFNSPKTIVELYGNLKVRGNRIYCKDDTLVVLRGMSLFWSQWGGHFYNENVIKWLRDDWKCTIVRAAIGVENGGYLTNPQIELQKAEIIIKAAIEYGIYVIVDWHDHNAQNHIQQAKEFFKIIAEKYGDKPNIIYEIYNEPLQVSWGNVIKPYAEEVIKIIRQYDPDNLIIVGTPSWSQDVDIAANNPLKDNNVAYSLHFYSSTHRQSLRNKAITALNKNLPLFVTEYGISEASGSGNIDLNEANIWMNFMETNKLSNCNWSIMDKNETSAALIPGANPKGQWKDDELTLSGRVIRNYIISKNSDIFKLINN